MLSPKVTVLMPVYNGEKYLEEAIESILNQTYADFEFLIIDDGSTDKSLEVIKSYNDSRIKIVCNDKNIGLVSTLNKGLDLACGEYIIRMDCDDISLPQRIQKQVAFMDNYPEVGICGTWIEEFGENVESRIFRYPISPDEIKTKLFFFSALAHPSVIIRKVFLKKFNLYYPLNDQCEDFEFWQKCSFYFDIANIPEVLLRYRISKTSKLRQDTDKLCQVLIEMDRKNLELMGLEVDDEILKIHQMICPLRLPAMSIDREFITKTEKWLERLLEANLISKRYPEPNFSNLIGERWFVACNINAQKLGLWVLNKFYRSKLRKWYKLNFKSNINFILKCLRSQFSIRS